MVIGSVINLKIQMRIPEGQHPITTPKTSDVKYNTQEDRQPTESWCCVNQHDHRYLSAPHPGTLLAQSQVLVLLLNARTFPSADEPGQFTFVACTTRKDMKSESFRSLLPAEKGPSLKKRERKYFSACTTRRTRKMKVYVTCCWLKKGPA